MFDNVCTCDTGASGTSSSHMFSPCVAPGPELWSRMIMRPSFRQSLHHDWAPTLRMDPDSWSLTKNITHHGAWPIWQASLNPRLNIHLFHSFSIFHGYHWCFMDFLYSSMLLPLIKLQLLVATPGLARWSKATAAWHGVAPDLLTCCSWLFTQWIFSIPLGMDMANMNTRTRTRANIFMVILESSLSAMYSSMQLLWFVWVQCRFQA